MTNFVTFYDALVYLYGQYVFYMKLNVLILLICYGKSVGSRLYAPVG